VSIHQPDRRRFTQCSWLFLCLLLATALVSSPALAASGRRPGGDRSVAARFLQDHPTAELHRLPRGVARVHGSVFERGDSPEHAARRFVDAWSGMFGVEPGELRPGAASGRLPHAQPLMFDRRTGRYRFTLVSYGQLKYELPVFRSDLRLLVRNEPDSPLVLAASALRDLRHFSLDASELRELTGAQNVARRFESARHAARARVPTLTDFGEPSLVVWAGVDDEQAEPAIALRFVANNRSMSSTGRPESWLFLVDARDGRVLYEEYLIYSLDVSGNVSGISTSGAGADFCEPEVPIPMPYARVETADSGAFADPFGDFTIPHADSSEVSVTSRIEGRHFLVTNRAGSDALLSSSVVPPGPVDFVHSASNTEEFARAEVNAYVESNVVRDWIVAANPSFPLIGSQLDFPVVVNRNDGLCPGNAWYDAGNDSINFCRAGSPHPNTAWSSVVHHEFGHHLVAAGGSGQGEYGEGMGDVMSVIVLDDPRVGLGFFGDCGESLRSADNALQYPCAGSIHECGQVLSGAVWDTRNALVLTQPAQYQQILMDLAVNSVLLHSGSSITPSITIDWLTLDDDDGDLANGTPHADEILAGFGAHGLQPQPPPASDACGDALPICPGTSKAGSTASAGNDGASSCGSSDASPDAWYRYTPSASGVATISLCNGGTRYDSVLSVHTSCPGTAGNELDCDDDACGVGGPSEVTLDVTAGETYLIRVTGWSGSAGDFEVSVSGPACDLACLSDSDCNDGDVCNGDEVCADGSCQAGMPLDCDDLDPCTSDSCSGGFCVNDPLHCDDADACTADRCVAGTCVNDPIIPCCGNLTCEPGEDCTAESCPSDCIGEDPVEQGVCGNGYCELGSGEDCLSCALDCRGKQSGKPGNRYCCGDGAGEGPVGCGDSRCDGGGFECTDSLPVGFCCGSGFCEEGEDSLNCALDCGTCVPSPEDCSDGVDNDCDAAIDCSDSECDTDPSCSPSCSPGGAACSADDECCSSKCRNGRCRGG
jgi:hypothetical protein